MSNGLKGLTAEDRANWEKQYQSELQGYSPEEVERVYRNTKFKEKFGNDPNYETYKKLTPEQRDSLYNADFFVDNSQNIATEETDSFDNGLNNIDFDALAKELNIYEDTKNRYKQNYRWQQAAINSTNRLLERAEEVSPYYRKYKNTFGFEEGELEDLTAEYNTIKDVQGMETADQYLNTIMQQKAEENQSIGEKLYNTVAGIGASAASMPITLAGMVKGLTDYAIEDDLSFVDAITANNWVDYANDIVQYGSMIPSEIKKAKEVGISNLEILGDGIEDQFLRLVRDQGFTTGSMLLSGGLNMLDDAIFQGLRFGAKGAAKMAQSANAYRSMLRTLQHMQKYTKGIGVAGLIGTTEGVIEANMAGKEFIEDAENSMNQKEDEMIMDRMNEIYNNSNLFNEYIDKTGWDREQLKKDLNNPESSERTQEAVRMTIYQQLIEENKGRREELQNKINENAEKVRAVTLVGNSIVNGFLNTTFKAGLHAAPVQEALQRSRLGRMFSTRGFDISPDNVVTPKVGVATRALNILQEPASEMFEEGSQTVISSAAIGGGEANFNRYLEHKYSPRGQEILNDSIIHDLKGALSNIEGAEVLESGIHGALGSIIGSPMVRKPQLKRQEGQSPLSYIAGLSPVTYRNPIWEAIQEQRKQSKEAKVEAEALTEWLKNPENKKKYDGLAGTFSWLEEMKKSIEEGKEYELMDSQQGKLIHDMIMLEKLKGTSYHDAFMQSLEDVLTAEEGSVKAASLVSQYKSELGAQEKSDSEILQLMQNNASKMLKMVESVKKESKSLDSIFGNAIDSDVKEALIWGKVQMDNFQELLPQLEEEINPFKDLAKQKVSALSDEQKSSIAKYGSLSTALEKKKKALEQIQKIKEQVKKVKESKEIKDKDKKKIVKRKQEQIKNIEEQVEEINVLEEIKQTDAQKEDVLTELDIMNLSVEERAMMLNPANRGDYSKKQLKVIDSLTKKLKAKDSKAITKIQNAGKMKLAIEGYIDQYNSILADPTNFNIFAQNIKQKSIDDNNRKQYENLKNFTNYEDFVNTVDGIRMNTSPRELAILRDTLKDNEFYKRMEREDKLASDITEFMLKNEKFADLGPNDLYLLTAFSKYLSRKGINTEDYDSMVASLTETDSTGKMKLMSYIEDLNSKLPRGVKVSLDNIGEMLTTYKNALAGYKSNKALVEKTERPIEEKEVAALPPAQNIPVEEPKKGSFADKKPSEGPTPDAGMKPSKFKLSDNGRRYNEGTPIISRAEYLAKLIEDSNASEEVQNEAFELLNDVFESPFYNGNLEAFENILNKAIETLPKGSSEAKELLKSITKKKNNKSNEEHIKEKQREESKGVTLSNIPKNSYLGQVIESSGGERIIRSGKIKRGSKGTKVQYVVLPEHSEKVKESMGASYVESEHAPVFAVIEASTIGEEGNILIGDKKYVAIGVLPSSSKDAKAKKIRELALKTPNKLAANGNILLSSQATINSPALQGATQESGDKNLIDLIEESQEVARASSRGFFRNGAIQNKIKQILDNLWIGEAKPSDRDQTPLFYLQQRLKGDTVNHIQLFTNSLEEIKVKGESFLEFIKNSDTAEIISSMRRLKILAGKLDEVAIRDTTQLATTEGKEHILNNIAATIKDVVYFKGKLGLEWEEGESTEVYLTLDGKKLGKITTDSEGIFSSDDAINIIKNIFLDGENLRKGTYFQVDKDLVPKEGEENKRSSNFYTVYSDLIQDGILRAGIQSLDRVIESVVLDTPVGIKDNTPVSNPPTLNEDNAGAPLTDGPIDPDTGFNQEGDDANNDAENTLKKAREIVERIVEDSKRISEPIDDGELSYYEDNKTQRKYRRVTQMKDYEKDAVPFEKYAKSQEGEVIKGKDGNPILNPWNLPSTSLGNQADLFVRDFFSGILDSKFTKDELSEQDKTELKNKYPNFTIQQLKKLYNDLKKLKETQFKNLHIASEGIKAIGNIATYDESGNIIGAVDVAGTLDLLAYDNEGNFYIFDMKTHHGEIKEETKEKWAKQLFLYRELLQKKYGIVVRDTKIIPIKVGYPNPSIVKPYTKGEKENEILFNNKSFSVTELKLEDPFTLLPIPVKPLHSKLEINNNPTVGVNTQDDEDFDIENIQMDSEIQLPDENQADAMDILNAPKPKNLDWNELTAEQRIGLVQKGYVEEDWNDFTEKERQDELTCLGL